MIEGIDGLDEEVLQEIRQSPVSFVEHLFDKEPYSYQRDFLEADNSQRLFVAGRQVGKSTAMVWYTLWNFATKPGHNTLIIAPSQRQSVEFFDQKLKAEIEPWIENPEAAGITYETKSRLESKHGSRIVALTAAGEKTKETVRTYTADTIIVDEAAFIDDEFYTSVLRPMLLHSDGDFILGGTPWGQHGYFYNKFNDDRWFQVQVSSYECPAIAAEKIDEWREEMTKNEFKREILGEFTQPENAAINAEIIKEATFSGDENEPERVFPYFQGESCFLGVDPARHGEDRSVYVSIDDKGNIFDVKTQQDSSLTEVEGQVRAFNDMHGYDSILVDETGIGGGPLDSLKRDMYNVDGYEFSLKTKQDLYQTFIKHLEEGELTLPDKRSLLGELKDLQYEMTPRGQMKFHAPEGGTDDFADALALAVWCMRDGKFAAASGQMYSFGDEGGERTL